MASTNPAREYVSGIIKKVYESRGFKPFTGVEATFKKDISENSSVEADSILVVNETLKQLGIQNVAIYLSHHGVLIGILETIGVPAELHHETFSAIRNFNKYNVQGFVNELLEAGISERATEILLELFLKTDEILNQEHDVNRTVVTNLLNIVNNETLAELGQILRLTGRTPVLIDPGLACEPPYTPGIVIEARTSGLDILGSGGCVEEETTVFTFTYDIETIIALMENSGAFPTAIPVSNAAAVL